MKTFTNYDDNHEEAEAKFRLKYFYFIDIDTISQEVEKHVDNFLADSSKHPSTTSVNFQNILYKIFDTIYKSCELYTNVLTNLQQSFFGHRSDELMSTYHCLLNISLQSHCIMKDFFRHLNKRISKNDSACFSEISHKQDYRNKSGYFMDCKKAGNYPNQLSLQSIYQLKKQFFRKESDYSIKLLQMMIPKSDSYGKIKLIRHYAVACDFLFYPHIIHVIDDQLNEIKKNYGTWNKDHNPSLPSSLWINYSTLEHEYQQRKNGVIPSTQKTQKDFILGKIKKTEFLSVDDFKLTGTNLLLFEAPLEYFYGFSSIRSILHFLDEVEGNVNIDTANVGNINYSYFKGETIKTLCSTILNNPLVYSRHFFLKYAVNSAISCYNFNISSLAINNPFFGTTSHHQYNYSKDTNFSMALSTIREFFDFLTYIIIPILEDAWMICISKVRKLLNKKGFNTDIIDLYRIYIDNNINLLTADFSLLSNKSIQPLNEAPFLTKQQPKSSYIEQLKALLEKEHEEIQPKQPLNYVCNFLSSKRSIEELLYSYLFNRFPAIHGK